MAKKMPRQLVALSSSAIAAIYLAGFVYTRGADAGLGSAATSVPTSITLSPAATSVSQPTAVVSASAPASSLAASTSGGSTSASGSASSTAASTSGGSTASAPATSVPVTAGSASAPATSAAASVTSGYKDGTYTGSGTSRRGGVNVSVTIQSGRIANVTITSVNTQYPVSRIASLPAQVISRQSGQVDNVSGATYSAQAFRTAVLAALSMASA